MTVIFSDGCWSQSLFSLGRDQAHWYWALPEVDFMTLGTRSYAACRHAGQHLRTLRDARDLYEHRPVPFSEFLRSQIEWTVPIRYEVRAIAATTPPELEK